MQLNRRTLARRLACSVGASSLLPDDLRGVVLRRLGYRLHPSALARHGCTWLGDPGDVIIGPHCFINVGCVLDGPVTLEKGAKLGHGVTIVSGHHDFTNHSRRAGAEVVRAVTIGAGCWLGANVTVLPGVRIGAGAVVAAGAVVTADVEPDTLVGGVPARLIRRLASEPDTSFGHDEAGAGR